MIYCQSPSFHISTISSTPPTVIPSRPKSASSLRPILHKIAPSGARLTLKVKIRLKWQRFEPTAKKEKTNSSSHIKSGADPSNEKTVTQCNSAKMPTLSDIELSLGSLCSVDSGGSTHQYPQGINDPQNVDHDQDREISPDNDATVVDIHHTATQDNGVTRTSTGFSLRRNQSSALSRKLNSVPMSERRGILALVCLIPEYRDARNYSPRVKLTIVSIVALAAITGPMGTSIMLPAIDNVAADLDTTVSTVNISVGIYLLSLGIFPLWWSSLSETLGRRSVYVISFILFCIFSIGSSLSPSIGALIGFRVLIGGFSALVQSVGAGTIGDLYVQEERGRAMGLYYLGPLMGPFLAPIIGGAVSQGWGWRATQWFMVIISGCNVLLIVFGLPETLRLADNPFQNVQLEPETDKVGNDDPEKVVGNDVESIKLKKTMSNISRRSYRSMADRNDEDEVEAPILDPIMPTLTRLTTNRSARADLPVRTDEIKKHTSPEQNISANSKNLADVTGKESDQESTESESHRDNGASQKTDTKHWKSKAYDFVVRPLHSLNLLRYPPVILVIMLSLVNFSVIYFFNLTISYEYARDPYNFSSVILGLMYIPNSVTYVIASVVGGRWIDHLLKKYREKHGVAHPEARLGWNIVLAIVLVIPACLIFGWCIDKKQQWVTPLIGSAIFGFALMMIIGATVTYLVDTLPGKGATGVALNNLVRMILATIATFVVDAALKEIGPGILFLILMGIQIVMSISILVLKKKGAFFRENYNLADYYLKL